MAKAIGAIVCGSSLVVLLNCLLVLSKPWAHVPVEESMRTFSNAIKGGHLVPDEEYLLYESDTGPGVITEQWFTGEGCMGENTTIRIYIDGEEYPSIEFLVLLGHGVGFVDSRTKDHAPWSTRRISADASDNNIYNTYQIPFSKSFKITAADPVGGTFWYIIRGVYNYPLMFGALQLPSTARLRLYKNVKVDLLPFQFIDLVDIHSSAGALFQVTLAASSSDFTYLEGCMRAYIDGSSNITFLSSGTEDFFLSAFYYNSGLFHSDNSGLTYKADPGTMSAYKFFEDDPVLFTKSFRLRWRCGEVIGTGFEECPNAFLGGSKSKSLRSNQSPKTKIIASPNVGITTVTTYTWVYEW